MPAGVIRRNYLRDLGTSTARSTFLPKTIDHGGLPTRRSLRAVKNRPSIITARWIRFDLDDLAKAESFF